MSLAGTRLTCFQSSARRVYPLPCTLPQRVRTFSSTPLYSRHRTRNLPRGASFLTPSSSRSLSLWPFSATSSSAPSKSLPADSPLPPPEAEPAVASDASFIPPESVSSHQLANGLPEGVDPSAPVELISPELVDAAVNVANSIPPPLQYGDLANLGLISWWPAGIVRYSLEIINVSCELNWFWTICAGTLFWRLVLFPVTVKTMQFTSKMALIQPQLQPVMERVTAASKSGDALAIQAARAEYASLFKSVGISPIGGMLPLVQLPVMMGVFFGIKKMCELPVPQLMHSGVSFLPDLTVADPTGLMAPAFAVTLFWQMTVSARDMDMQSRPTMPHIMNLMRFPGAPIFALLMNTLPSGIVLSIIFGSIITGLQSLLLRIPAVRRFLGIPIRPATTGRQTLPSFLSTAKWIKSSWDQQLEDARSKAEEQTRRKGQGPGRRRL